MAAAALQEVSDGRFLLGLGAGADEFLEWAGFSPRAPLERTRRALSELRSLLSGGVPSGWRREGHMRTPPVRVPIYVGAMGPRMLELAGETADGALPLLFPPEHFPAAAAQVALGAARAGRDPAAIDLAACIWCSIDADANRARRALAAKIAYYGASFSPVLLAEASLSPADFRPLQEAMAAGDVELAIDLVTPAMLKLGVAGGARDVLERCLWLRQAGATHISFGPPLGADPEAAIQTLARKVIPELAGPWQA
jgi:5,10-methylenetetrahydromethanopterin reductase